MILEFTEERDPLTEKIIGCAIEVHRQLGPGLLESIYESALSVEFELNTIIEEMERAVILEIKSVERYDPLFEAQVLTYLKITGLRRALLINFNSRLLKDGIKRFVL